jgi:hypothetical protein
MKEIIHNMNEFKKEDSRILSRLFENAPLTALNHLLFRCDPEEKDISNKARGPYGLDKYG